MANSPMMETTDQNDVRAAIAGHLVGRERELELLYAAVSAGRDVLLEGPPGTSKTTMLKAITAEWGIPLVLVEGNADLTPAKLVGHHSPARVMREGYTADNFIDGPLVEAMRQGGFLYMEEFNRAPEDTLNVLLMAIGDRSIAIPNVGDVRAAENFRVIGSMNPYDNVGTRRLSTSIHDRFCRSTIGYQDGEAEEGIVSLRTPELAADAFTRRLIGDGVAATRATRAHEDVRQGSSVRGAIDLVKVGAELGRLRGAGAGDEDREAYLKLLLDAMLMALSGRIQVHEAAQRAPEQILTEIWEDLFILRPAPVGPG
ncbi:MAG TPA: MoxR family ATPase [Solirubrobacterales bacterium]